MFSYKYVVDIFSESDFFKGDKTCDETKIFLTPRLLSEEIIVISNNSPFLINKISVIT